MVIGVGTDILEIERLRKLIDKTGERFIERCFTAGERAYCSGKVNRYERYAGRFSAKEAVCKALCIRWSDGLSWKDIEIVNSNRGAPEVVLSGAAKRIAGEQNVVSIFLSISHCSQYAQAFAVCTGGG